MKNSINKINQFKEWIITSSIIYALLLIFDTIFNLYFSLSILFIYTISIIFYYLKKLNNNNNKREDLSLIYLILSYFIIIITSVFIAGLFKFIDDWFIIQLEYLFYLSISQILFMIFYLIMYIKNKDIG